MKKAPLEMAKQIKLDYPEMFGKMNEKKIAKIIREAFKQLKKEIENTEDDIVKIPQLGNFRVRIVEQDNEGVKTARRKIIFRPSTEKK